MSLIVRDIQKIEHSFLDQMLYQAIFVHPGEQPPTKDIINHPDIAKYIEDFGREGDCCLVAELDGNLVGAIWTRIFSEQNKGYGFVDAQTPELCMAVINEYRGIGIGSVLLGKMLHMLKDMGYSNVSLSVDKRNYAINLYRLFNFTEIKTYGNSATLIRKL